MDRGIISISETGVITIPTAPIWMTKFEIADLFGVFSCDVRKAIHTIYKSKELNEFRICSKESVLFRRFIINEISTIKKATPIILFVASVRGNNRWYS